MTFSINQPGLCLLLNLFSPSIVVGFTDCTQGLLEEELIEIRKTTINDLKEEGLITPVNQGQLQIISPLKEMLQTIAHPTHAILVGAHSQGDRRIQSFHYSPDGGIVHMATSDGDQYELSVIKNRTALIDLIMEFHSTIPRYQDPYEPFCLLKKTIDDARILSHAGRQAAVVELLITAGLAKNIAEAYMQTIKLTALTIPLLAYHNMNNQHHLRLKAFITESNAEHLWVIEPVDEELEQVRVTHATRAMLEHKLDTILP